MRLEPGRPKEPSMKKEKSDICDKKDDMSAAKACE